MIDVDWAEHLIAYSERLSYQELLKQKHMVLKNQKSGNVENVTIVEFGSGTLALTLATDVYAKYILIKTIVPMPIGSSFNVGSTSDQFKPDVLLRFNNKKSFDVFCEVIDQLKQQFNKTDKLALIS